MRAPVRTIPQRLLIALAGLSAAVSPAFADRIDGEWCHSSGSLVIEGPKIRTPGGSNIEGRYSHHNFSYKVPASEPDAGTEIAMQQHNEETMTLTRQGKLGETWKRCKVTS
jgi:hypothetical protein